MWEDLEKGVFRKYKRIDSYLRFNFIEKVVSKNINQKKGGKKLNEILDVGLTADTLVKSKGYKSQKINKKLVPPQKIRPRLDPKKIKRIKNDVSFNYSQSEFIYEDPNL